jgi:hypothetical protein
MNAENYLIGLVQAYCQNEHLLRQAIKDFECRIGVKTQQLEIDKRVLELLIKKLNSGTTDVTDVETGTSNSQ